MSVPVGGPGWGPPPLPSVRGPRRFTVRQRRDLAREQNYLCADCRASLDANFHADHIHPWALGGPTTLENGQALCATCNLRKGVSVPSGANQIDGPYDWQDVWQQTITEIYTRGATKCLMHVAPGSGKTKAAIKGFEVYRRLKGAIPLVVVCPTVHIKQQWSETAEHMTCDNVTDEQIIMRTDRSDWLTRPGAPKHNALAVTYAAITAHPEHWARTLQGAYVILDEVHHAGERRRWGQALKQAMTGARFQLATTGTPFREDQCPIAGLSYDPVTYRVISDYEYTYASAVANATVRAATYRFFDATGTWVYRRPGRPDHVFSRTALESLTLEEQGQWLRTILSAENQQALPPLLTDAVVALEEERLAVPDAAGLVVCDSHQSAKKIRAMLVDLVGADAVSMVISDDPENAQPSAMLKEFAKSKINKYGRLIDNPLKWLVAVAMVSEGVDIPRLQVGVFLTDIKTELHFRQFVGRFTRRRNDLDPANALPHTHIFLPGLPLFKDFVSRIADDADSGIRERDEQLTRTRDITVSDDLFGPEAVSAIGYENTDTVFNGGTVTRGMQQVEAIIDECPTLSDLPHAAKCQLAESLLKRIVMPERSDLARDNSITNFQDEVKAIKSRIQRLIKTYVVKTGSPWSEMPAVQSEFNNAVGISSRADCEDLKLLRELEATIEERIELLSK